MAVSSSSSSTSTSPTQSLASLASVTEDSFSTAPGSSKEDTIGSPAKKINVLLKSAKINVFVGRRPDLELVARVPKEVLAHFSSVLSEIFDQGAQVVILTFAEKKAVDWLARWMLAGGAEKEDSSASDGPVLNALIHRLQLVCELKIHGLVSALTAELHAALLIHPISPALVNWIYGHTSKSLAPTLRGIFARALVSSILELGAGEKPKAIHTLPDAAQWPEFAADIAAAVESKENCDRLHRQYFPKRSPIPIAMLKLVYKFSATDSIVRKTVAKDLLASFDMNNLEPVTVSAYWEFADDVWEFHYDMEEAIDGQRKRKLEKKAAQKTQTVRKASNVSRKAGTQASKVESAPVGDQIKFVRPAINASLRPFNKAAKPKKEAGGAIPEPKPAEVVANGATTVSKAKARKARQQVSKTKAPRSLRAQLEGIDNEKPESAVANQTQKIKTVSQKDIKRAAKELGKKAEM
ncbi:hypothetical protein MMC20_003763 [Loxospora ochrophaea]|nr:hypothetical protein [Loxospora ochrophaea]